MYDTSIEDEAFLQQSPALLSVSTPEDSIKSALTPTVDEEEVEVEHELDWTLLQLDLDFDHGLKSLEEGKRVVQNLANLFNWEDIVHHYNKSKHSIRKQACYKSSKSSDNTNKLGYSSGKPGELCDLNVLVRRFNNICDWAKSDKQSVLNDEFDFMIKCKSKPSSTKKQPECANADLSIEVGLDIASSSLDFENDDLTVLDNKESLKNNQLKRFTWKSFFNLIKTGGSRFFL